MPVSVVIGGQYGSEGKGKIAYHFAKKQNATAVIRVGGSNSGHTVIDDHGVEWIFRQLPTAVLIPEVICVIPAGAYVNAEVLLKEIQKTGLSSDRLFIDPNAVLITENEIHIENSGALKNEIGSTQSGTGAAVMKRIGRRGDVHFVSEDDRLDQYVRNTQPYLRHLLEEDKRILIEGTQGYGLSVLHSDHYPFVTSRDTSAAGFLAEAGLSPLDVNEVIMVLRSFPIRVGGNSGPLKFETDWESVQSISGKDSSIREYTTVTQRLRRVAHFDPELVRKAIIANNPTTIVLNHLDYIDGRCETNQEITEKAYEFLLSVEERINRKIDYVGVSPKDILPVKIEKNVMNEKDLEIPI